MHNPFWHKDEAPLTQARVIDYLDRLLPQGAISISLPALPVPPPAPVSTAAALDVEADSDSPDSEASPDRERVLEAGVREVAVSRVARVLLRE